MEHQLHPHTKVVLDSLLQGLADPKTFEVATFRVFKPGLDELVGAGEEIFRSWNASLLVEGVSLPVRWYLPSSSSPELLTIFVHGGGWVSGTLDAYDALCRSLALRSAGAVLSLDYALSPEAKFPAAIDEVRSAVLNAVKLAAAEGLMITRLAVAGDSAGGNIVAGALHSLAAIDQMLPAKAVFIYPATDTSMDYQSWRDIGSAYNLDSAKMKWFWEQYLGPDWQHSGGAQGSPLNSEHLDRFPESLVITATHDPLKDEGREFYRRLKAAGTNALHIEVPGQIHGFIRFRQAMTDPQWGADAVMQRIGDFLQS